MPGTLGRTRLDLRAAAWLALVLAAAGATFFGVLDNGFVGDDGPCIVWNEALRAPLSLQRVLGGGDDLGTGSQNPYYRPVTTLSFAFDVRLFGERPVGYHATNLLLHLAVCALLFLAALKQTGRQFAAGAAALLFAVHPATVEAVAYISARAELLCAALMLATWLLYLRARETGSSRELALAGLAFAFAGLAKIVALGLLPALALHELRLARRGEGRLRRLIPFAALAAAQLLARAVVLERMTWETGVPFLSRLATAGPLLLTYVRNTVLPFELRTYYDEPVRTDWADPAVVGAWAALVACAAGWVLLARRRPAVAFGIAWFIAALVPASGVVDLLYPALMADRYLYVPLAGAALAVAGAIPDPGTRDPRQARLRRLAATAAGCAALIAYASALAVTSARRIPAWRDSVTLWEDALRGAPASPYVLNALGWSYWQVNRLGRAERLLAKAAAAAPGYADPRVNLAAVAFLKGDVKAAARHTEEALRIAPRDPTALRYRAILLADYGRLDLAIEALEAAVAADPFDPQSRRYLSELKTAQRSEREAPPPGAGGGR